MDFIALMVLLVAVLVDMLARLLALLAAFTFTTGARLIEKLAILLQLCHSAFVERVTFLV